MDHQPVPRKVGEKPVGVIVTGHAAARPTERFPNIETRDPRAFITYEIHRALEAGRRSTRVPMWAAIHEREHPGRQGTYRFFWSEDEQRCYPAIRAAGLKDERRDEFKETWQIMTCLPRLSEEAMHTAAQQRKAKRTNYGRKPRGRRG